MKALLVVTALMTGTGTAAAQSAGSEPYRPQFHFTPERNWMNDPNGMVYFDGEYHLFYQYNPFGDKWGHMSWGHAVSKDLVRWEHLPVAIPEADNVMAFSGSAVVDWKNTSGYGRNGEPPLVALYTGHHTDRPRQDQRLAYSIDRGRTWTNDPENPVLDLRAADFRDPKVLWHEASRQWVMVVAIPVERKVGFYGSPDLRHWRPLSEFGPAGSVEGIWECPDLFPLDGRWVLVVNVGGGAPSGGSGCQYFVGDFDGRTFTADPRTHPGLAPGSAYEPQGTVLADFESGYGDWKATGEAFGEAPATGPLEGQMMVEGFLGKAFVNSFSGGDQSTGTLTSPEFVIDADFLNFLIGGGAHAGKTCLNLLVDDTVVRTATGSEAERLSWKGWDVRDLRGKRARLRIVDDESGGWGHVNVDHIHLADEQVRTVDVLWADYGSDFYAAVSWSDIPESDGRRIWLAWMSNWQYAQDVPTAPWRSAMTVPRQLKLRDTPLGFRLVQEPVRELEALREDTRDFAGGSLEEANAWLAANSGQLLDVTLELDPTVPVTLRIVGAEGAEIRVEIRGDTLALDRRNAGRVGFHPRFPSEHVAPLRREPNAALMLRVLLDTSSIEVFANGGETVLTDLFFPDAGPYTLSLHAADPAALPTVGGIRLSKLKTAL